MMVQTQSTRCPVISGSPSSVARVTHDLVTAVRTGLAELANPAKAPEMRAYMKSAMPFRGVQKPARARLAAAMFDEYPLPDRESWLKAVLDLWRDAEYREERYLA